MRSLVTPELVDIFTKLGDKILQISNYKLKLNIFDVGPAFFVIRLQQRNGWKIMKIKMMVFVWTVHDAHCSVLTSAIVKYHSANKDFICF